jgi:hypothetical protein
VGGGQGGGKGFVIIVRGVSARRVSQYRVERRYFSGPVSEGLSRERRLKSPQSPGG